MSIKEKILSAQDKKFRDEFVAEWDTTVRIQAMTGHDLATFYSEVGETKGKEFQLKNADFMTALLIRSLYDPDTGERLFTDKESGPLGSRSAEVLRRLFQMAQEINGLGAEATEQIEKN